MAIVGYARVSTLDQEAGHAAQIAALKDAGCTRIFEERVSSVDITARVQLAEAIRYVRDGDVFVIFRLDRLARHMKDLMATIDELHSKGVALRVLDPRLETSGGKPGISATGDLILGILGAVAQFERSIMLERQREGIKQAKADGKLRGRAPTAMAKAKEVMALINDGVSPSDAARRLGIGRRSVYRVIDLVGRGEAAPTLEHWPKAAMR